MWFNEKGVRFADENYASHVPDRGSHCLAAHEKPFAIFTEAMVHDLMSLDESLSDYVDEAINANVLKKAASISEIAQATEVDEKQLSATIEEYNKYCDNGYDPDFAKDPSCLIGLGSGPYYFIENNGIYFVTTIGGISTTAATEVRKSSSEIINGLFAVGVDGAELWREIYTIDVPESCNANNINTGRIAAQEAHALL